jgi:tricorn protease
VTSDFTDDHDPVFDPEGKYLYFRSLRHFDPTFSSFENEFTFNDASQIYAVTLAADTESPVKPESDEEGKDEEDAKKDGDSKGGKDGDKKDGDKKDGDKKDGDKKDGKGGKGKKEVKPVQIDPTASPPARGDPRPAGPPRRLTAFAGSSFAGFDQPPVR